MKTRHESLFKILDSYKDKMTGETLADLQRDLVLLMDEVYEDWNA